MTLLNPKMYPHTKYWDSCLKNIVDMLWTRFDGTEVRGQGQGCSDLKTTWDTSQSQDVSTHQICDSYLK